MRVLDILNLNRRKLNHHERGAAKGDLTGAGTKPASAEQMELARLRAENARLKMERDVLSEATAYFAKESL